MNYLETAKVSRHTTAFKCFRAHNLFLFITTTTNILILESFASSIVVDSRYTLHLHQILLKHKIGLDRLHDAFGKCPEHVYLTVLLHASTGYRFHEVADNHFLPHDDRECQAHRHGDEVTNGVDNVASAPFASFMISDEFGELVQSLEFRQDAVRSFFEVYTNQYCNVLLLTAIPPNNSCPFCSTRRPQECFFFHPTMAQILLKHIKEYDHMRYRLCHDEYLNSELLERLFKLLPLHFARLGYPSQNGRLWGCVVDKFEQTFPREVFMMTDIRVFLQKKWVEREHHTRYRKIKEKQAESRKLLPDIATSKTLSQIVEEEEDLFPVFYQTEPTCGCRFYIEGNCPVYEEFIKGKAIHTSSSQYADYLSRKLPMRGFFSTVNAEFDDDWEQLPVCAQSRLRAFLQRECQKRYDENRANEERIVAAKKESAAKYKQSKLRSRKPRLEALPY